MGFGDFWSRSGLPGRKTKGAPLGARRQKSVRKGILPKFGALAGALAILQVPCVELELVVTHRLL